ncbi:efflux RND transporter periplasmic adaptor subunit [Halomonas sp. NO4]|uniref:efflux RND transporter periplasmic adaptor subunit n=1 Tax=Halomonas sp. NO4 TaxID=2484813 RepID=UPI0013D60722|nr:efflux RND transporter periplasmic adaptor subunit [Halomonas sp. NO4]
MLVAPVLASVHAEPARGEPVAQALPAVRSVAVRLSAAEARYRFPGTLRARKRASPAFLHAGVLRERRVGRGQRVEAGEPLARLHNPAMAPGLAAAEARVRELEARLRRLEQDVSRVRTLRERNHSAEDELDRLVAERDATVQAREQALARRDEAAAQLDELTLRAPFAAEVTDLLVEPGEFVAAGQPILNLAGLGAREVEIRVPASLAERLAVGQPAQLMATFGAQRVAGQVRDIGGAGASMAPVVIAVDAATAPALGESLWVQLAAAAPPALQVPLAAVVDPGGHDPHVLVLDDDERVHRVAVTPGRLAQGWVAVSSPSLSAGNRVVTAGQGRLTAGDRVKVLP